MANGLELRKTAKPFWEGTHVDRIRYRLPSWLNIGTANILRLLRPHMSPGASVLEIGYAPGKILAYLGLKCGAKVSGVDYSEKGVAVSRSLFRHLGLEADLRCEDIFASTISEQSFDFVYSLGFIEHFDNPAIAIEQHFRYLKPGGRSVIAIPNYGGLYGRLQAKFDPDNLAIHNLDIMRMDSLRRLTEGLACSETKVYAFGRINPWLISFERKWPTSLAFGLKAAGNLAGLLQPVDFHAVCPFLVLEFTREPV